MTSNEPTMTSGDRIKALRTARALTQEDLAEMAGLGLATIQRAERGLPVSAATIASLAAAFNIGAQALTVQASAPDTQPYVPLQPITAGRQLLSLLRAAERLDFGFAELDDLDQAALIGSLHDFCQILGPQRTPSGPLAQVKEEVAARDLLATMAACGLVVSGETFTLDCHEIDDDCGGGMPVLMAKWKETRAVLRVGAAGIRIERGYIVDAVGEWESPSEGVVWPPQTEIDGTAFDVDGGV
jgi:transcriptional regulator with XRE-family HTH domain